MLFDDVVVPASRVIEIHIANAILRSSLVKVVITIVRS